ncbi:hypothetical protein RJ641_031650 [Dillenia turbinata]|uniref:Glycosyltransferase N-terminal domain-containing protein n=1 Tax=Dillenia turbinata TaxID=194707 RepID=A0AAN8W309_9MAGN
MGSFPQENKPHAVCLPFPAQGHVNPMLKVAKLLHAKGFHITFVNSEYNHRRLLKSRGAQALRGLPSFRFATIPDGLPPSDDDDVTQHVPSLCESTRGTCLAPFRDLVNDLNRSASSSPDVPPVTCIVSDGIMTFTLKVARELGIPDVLFWTNGAAGVMGYFQYRNLIQKGLVPLRDTSDLTNGYLDSVIDWIPGMKGIRLKDLPSFIRTTDPDDIMLNFAIGQVEKVPEASALILNTFDDLEQEIIDSLSSLCECLC